MDEPSANLDPAARKVFFKYLENYDKDSLMIISSHRVKELENLANRVVEMDLGEVVVDKQL
jgi:ABC-2 type transport system ATP-binding protein